MNKIKILLGLVLLVSTSSYGQSCNCMEEYKWAKKTFEENDAGYSYYLEKYGKQAIEFNNKKWEKEFAKTTDIIQCQEYLNQWIKFYRKGHIAIAIADQTKMPPSDLKTLDKTEVPKINIDSFKTAVKLLKEASVEGIWTNGTYEVGIQKVKDDYVGFVINSQNEQWKAGQVKFTFPFSQNSTKKSTYYMGDHSLAGKHFDPCQLIGNTYLKAFDIYWKRLSPDFDTEPDIENEVLLLSATNPFIKKIDSENIILRIPSFENNYITVIDSLVKTNHDLLLSTKNLIIDIRGNGGGVDRAYDSIAPYLYTNPVRSMWVEFLSTPVNNARYDWIIKLDGFSEEERQKLKEMQKKLNNNIGKFVNLNESNQTFVNDSLPKVYQNPQHVAILIDGGNGSTAEQFLLMAKQSKKVKLFGQRTAGALDFSNLNDVTSPSKNFNLFYTTSRSFRIPKMAIDDYGIQPDYFIDDSVPTYKWIEFVTEIMKDK